MEERLLPFSDIIYLFIFYQAFELGTKVFFKGLNIFFTETGYNQFIIRRHTVTMNFKDIK